VTTLVILLAVGAIVGSYLWTRRQMDTASPQALVTLLLRAVGFLFVLFFLFQPSRLPAPKQVLTERTLAVLLDTSASMSQPSDAASSGASRWQQVQHWIKQHGVLQQIRAEAKLAVYGFSGRSASVDPETLAMLQPDGRETNLAAAAEQVIQLHKTDDLAGLLIFTDGRDTQATKPIDQAAALNTPMFFVPVGEAPDRRTDDDAPRAAPRDLAIETVTADPRIVLGRDAQIIASIRATGYPARQVAVELRRGDEVVSRSTVATSPQQQRRQASFIVQPDQVGDHHYQLRIAEEPGETDPTNNLRELTIEVVDPVHRLIYLDRMRDEWRFLKTVLAGQQHLRYATAVQLDDQHVIVQGNDEALKQTATRFSAGDLQQLKVLILGDLPAAALTAEQRALIVDWVDRGGALMLLGGPASLGEQGFAPTSLGEILPAVFPSKLTYVQAEWPVKLTTQGAAHPIFQRVEANWAAAPPLLSRIAVQDVKPAANVLLVTDQPPHAPIAIAYQYGHGRVVLILSDTTWRWQLAFDSAVGGFAGRTPHQVFWSQTVDWLLPELEQPERNEGRVQIISDRVEYEVGQEVMLMVKVVGADGQAMTDSEVAITVATPDDRPIHRDATWQSDTEAATARFETYAAGPHAVQAVATRPDGSTIGSDELTLRVTQPVVEFADTTPDRALLEKLAEATGGVLLEPAVLGRLTEVINLQPRELMIQPNAAVDAEPAWNHWYLILAFVGVMGTEWLVRRMNRWV
jgi:hypothetical protein